MATGVSITGAPIQWAVMPSPKPLWIFLYFLGTFITFLIYKTFMAFITFTSLKGRTTSTVLLTQSPKM